VYENRRAVLLEHIRSLTLADLLAAPERIFEPRKVLCQGGAVADVRSAEPGNLRRVLECLERSDGRRQRERIVLRAGQPKAVSE
jgi:hypothetical protein